MRRILPLWILSLSVICIFSGCGGGSNPITIALSVATATVQAGGTMQFTATVANDSANKGASWSVSCSVAQCGSVSPTTTQSGMPTTYTAPTTAPASDLTVTITVTSVADSTKKGTIIVTVPAITVTVAPPAPMVLVGATQNFTATVANTSNTAVTWKLTQGGAACTAACGTLSSAATNPVTYTPPTGAGNLTITITATSAADATKTGSATITVPAITVSVAPSSANVAVSGFTAFTATVGNDGANKGATWALSQGGAACAPATCGTINAGPTPSGSGTTYQAPASMPANPNVTVTATSVTDPSKTASATVIITPVSVSVSPTTATVQVNQTQQFTATVTFDAHNLGVSWTITSGGTPCPLGCGSVSPSSSLSGVAVTYTAPTTVPGGTVTLTATSTTDPTKTASATITVTVASGILVAITQLPPSSMIAGSTANVTATVTNDTMTKGVDWTVTCGSPGVCGSFNPAHTASGVATVYTAPGGVPAGMTVTITATSTADTTKSASVMVTITAASACASGGSESLLSGGYAILLKGLDSSGNPVLIGGVLTFNGTGSITAGAIDMNLANGPSLDLTVTSGSYGAGSDHRGCMVITAGGVTLNFRFSLGNISGTPAVAATGHVIGFDTAGPFVAGIMRKQSGPFTNASVTGSFAFGGSSIQNTAVAVGGGKLGIVGVIAFDGVGGVTGGSEDINQNGTLNGTSTTPWPAALSISSAGSFYNIASNGKGILTIAIVGVAGSFHLALYAVSPGEALFMTRDAQITSGIVGGEALLQTGAGSFTGTSVTGTYVGYSSALGSSTTTSTTATDLFLLSVVNPNITGTDTRNDGGMFGTGSIHSPTTYTVSPSGRVVTTGGMHPPVLYIVNSNEAFFLGSNGRVDTGFLQSQTSTSASGTYAFGSIDPEDLGVSDQSGVATFTSATTTLSGTSDSNSSGTLTRGSPFGPQSYSIDSTGLVHIPSGCTISATSTTCQTLIYVISPTKAVAINNVSTTETHPNIQPVDQ